MNDITDYALTDMVWKNSSLAGSAKLVAVGLARAFDSRRGYSRYPLDYLVKDTGLSRPTVVSALNEVEESGEWSFARKGGSRGTLFYPNFEKLTEPQPKRKAAKRKEEATNEKPAPKTKTKPKARTVTAVDGYPSTDEDTDPMLNGLPLLASNPKKMVVPPVLNTAMAMAIRLHRRTDLSTRLRPQDFTVNKLKGIIDHLSIVRQYPLEAIDILLWLQCENKQALSESFLSTVLGMCTKDGEIVKPQQWNGKPNPAYDVASNVYEIYRARHTGDKYVESL
ncbi:MAG: hypothetical protein H9W81_04310 [Enterococcus sp.]|nr:hypothetical protein [Enterococcus sp.]